MRERAGYSYRLLRGASVGVLFALAFHLEACDLYSHSAAGIIAFSRIQGETYVLLADHVDSDRGWGTFGGRRSAGESIARTASREFREETRCVYAFPSEADLADVPRVGDKRFWSYVIEVPFVPAEELGNRPAPEDCRGPDYRERGPWAWIPLSELIQVLENPDPGGGFTLPAGSLPPGSRTRLWSDSARILQAALGKGLLE